MNFVSCENPKIIKNKYTDEKISVACGKCAACRNAKVAELVSRLDFETSLHRFAYFVTLTYSNEHLPKAHVSKLGNEEMPCITFEDKVLHFPLDTKGFVQSASHNLKVYSEKSFSFDLSCVKKSDLQNFIKNLRIKIFRRFGEIDSFGTKTKIRYFAVSEYGKQHLRCHWHLLLWFDSSEVREVFYSLVLSCWSYGRIDAQIVAKGASNYVAKYVNSVSIYPELYDAFFFKSARLQSKLPAVGVPEPDNPTFQKYFYSCTCTFAIKRFDKIAVSLFPQSYSDRWFPRFANFDALSFSYKLGLCYYAEKVDKIRYGFKIIEDTTLYVVEPKEIELSDSDMRCYYTSRRIRENAQLLNLSLYTYIQMIDKYYSNRSLYLLKLFYEFQEDFARSHPDRVLSLLCLYPVRCSEFLTRLRNNDLVEYDFQLLRMFDKNFPDISEMPFYDYPIDESLFDLSENDVVTEFIKQQRLIESESVKTKIINDKYFVL